MTYANLANSILGNTGRGSRDSRGGHRRDDRGQSLYENEREGVDAIDRDGLSILGITLVETGTYDPEFLRPYVVSANREDIDLFSDVVAEENGQISSADVAGIASRIMNYKHTVTDRDLVEIENGWDEKRFSFIFEVIERERDEFNDYNPDKEVVTYISGFTDCLDIANRTNVNRGSRSSADVFIAPETTFFVSNIRRIERNTRRIKTNNQLIVPAYYKNNKYRSSRDELFTLRPKDVFTTQSVNSIMDRNRDVARINNSNKLTGSQIKPSRATNVSPSAYLAYTVRALTDAETSLNQTDAYGNYDHHSGHRDSVYSKAKSMLGEDTAYEANSFLQLLRRNTTFGEDQSFTWREIKEIFGSHEIEDLTEIHQTDTVRPDARVSRAGDGAGWDNNSNSGRNAVFATVLKQALPGYAVESMIYACRIEASNILSRSDELDAVAGALVNVSDIVWATKLSQDMEDRLANEFEQVIARNILRDLSLNNAIDYDIVVELNWRFDSFIYVAIEGGEMLEFPTAGFANSLTSPIITTSQDTTDLIGQELNSIVNSILGR